MKRMKNITTTPFKEKERNITTASLNYCNFFSKVPNIDLYGRVHIYLIYMDNDGNNASMWRSWNFPLIYHCAQDYYCTKICKLCRSQTLSVTRAALRRLSFCFCHPLELYKNGKYEYMS